jgi:glutathione S-transferase
VTQFFHARAVGAWKVLDAHLKGRDFVVAGHPTIADLSLCGYLFWPDQIGMDPGYLSEHYRLAGPHRRPARLQATRRPDAERDGSRHGYRLTRPNTKHPGDTDG